MYGLLSGVLTRLPDFQWGHLQQAGGGGEPLYVVPVSVPVVGRPGLRERLAGQLLKVMRCAGAGESSVCHCCVYAAFV
jgi:hypothetical protein